MADVASSHQVSCHFAPPYLKEAWCAQFRSPDSEFVIWLTVYVFKNQWRSQWTLCPGLGALANSGGGLSERGCSLKCNHCFFIKISKYSICIFRTILLVFCDISTSLPCLCMCVWSRQESTGWLWSTSLLPAGLCCSLCSLRSLVSATYMVNITATIRMSGQCLKATKRLQTQMWPCRLGGNRLIKDIEMMLGEKSCTFWLWWRACWFCISPCIIMVGTATMSWSWTCCW